MHKAQQTMQAIGKSIKSNPEEPAKPQALPLRPVTIRTTCYPPWSYPKQQTTK